MSWFTGPRKRQSGWCSSESATVTFLFHHNSTSSWSLNTTKICILTNQSVQILIMWFILTENHFFINNLYCKKGPYLDGIPGINNKEIHVWSNLFEIIIYMVYCKKQVMSSNLCLSRVLFLSIYAVDFLAFTTAMSTFATQNGREPQTRSIKSGPSSYTSQPPPIIRYVELNKEQL